MERKRHLEGHESTVYDDIYSELEPVQSKITKSDYNQHEVVQSGQEDYVYQNEQNGLDFEEGFVDEAEVDEFSFVDENPSMSQIQSAQLSDQSGMTSTNDEIEHSENYSCPNNQYMEMPPAKNTLQNNEKFFVGGNNYSNGYSDLNYF